jgi:hypothetical protein
VQVILKAHERRYIQAASAAIRDLLLLNCLPKAAAPPAEHDADGAPPPEVWLPIGDAPIPQRLTRYTVLRSPHVDKKSREQFERKVHKRCISVPAIEEHELRWLLDSIKLYEFPGGRRLARWRAGAGCGWGGAPAGWRLCGSVVGCSRGAQGGGGRRRAGSRGASAHQPGGGGWWRARQPQAEG